MSKYRELLRQYFEDADIQRVPIEVGLRLLSFADWLDLQEESRITSAAPDTEPVYAEK